jgi:TolB-like protein/DNA-binding winged helix-turn-helix (wHTH) protein
MSAAVNCASAFTLRFGSSRCGVLIALLERPGDVIGREEFASPARPHGTFVDFEHSLNAAVRRFRLALGDDADVPRFVETVHKRGYRFLAPSFTPRRCREPWRAAPATIAHIVRNAHGSVLPSGPYDGVTEGLTEEAMTQLTQVCPRTIGVIARTSVERAQREGGGAAEIGRALSADYLVEGHVRRDGDRVRITAQLIESQGETHLWARTFDRVMTDALSLQAEVAEEIAKAVTDTLSGTKHASA